MPFPLAHPAAVLPLRRFCPQRLNFPALVLGSLVPDLGYFGPDRVAEFSHRFVGAFGFDLPVGFLIWLLFYGVRLPAIGLLPKHYREALLPLCRPPVGFPFRIGVSVLIGTWTHLLLDSVTHENGWLVQRLPLLQHITPWVGYDRLRIYDLLYYVCTFCGAGWLAISYLRWQATILEHSSTGGTNRKWGYALLAAILTLVIAGACRGNGSMLGLCTTALISGLLVLGFLVACGIDFIFSVN